jgi:hypothetical protein
MSIIRSGLPGDPEWEGRTFGFPEMDSREFDPGELAAMRNQIECLREGTF